MRPLLKAFVFMILLHLASGAVITSVQTFHDTLDVKEGELLLILCQFILDEPLEEQMIELEWEMTRKESEEFRPLIHLNGTTLLPVQFPNSRAWMDLKKVKNGNCSLMIDSVQMDDIGTYTIRLAIDEKEYKDSPEIKVHVSPRHTIPSESDLPTKQLTQDHLFQYINSNAGSDASNNADNNTDNNTDSRIQPGTYTTELGVIRIAKVLQAIKKNGILLFLAILLVIIILLHLVGAGTLTYFEALYFHLKRRIKDASGPKEQGILNGTLEDGSEVQNTEGGPNEVSAPGIP